MANIIQKISDWTNRSASVDKDSKFAVDVAGNQGYSDLGGIAKKIVLAPGTLLARPAANTVPEGAYYTATDVRIIYRSTGAAWVVALDVNATAGGLTVKDPRLAAFTTALEGAASAVADVVMITDSIGVINGVMVKKFERQLAGLFNGQNAITTKALSGFLYADPTSASLGGRMGTGNGSASSLGLGGFAASLAVGETRQQSVTCDGVIVVWRQGAGTLTVKDGGSGGTTVATINTTGGTAGSGNQTSIDLTTYAAHDIYIVNSVGTSVLEGIYPTSGNRTVGARVWPASHSGATTQDFIDNPAWGLDMISKLNNPHVILMTGILDSTANYPTRMQTLVDQVQSRTTGNILLVSPYGRSGEGKSKSDSAEAIALAEGISHLSLFRHVGDVSDVADKNKLSYDGTHPAVRTVTAITDLLMAKVTGNGVGLSMTAPLRSSMTDPRQHYGTVLLESSGGGSAGIESLLTLSPVIGVRDANGDANMSAALYNEFLLDLLGAVAGGGGLVLGVGGGTAPGVFVTFDGTGIAKVNGRVVNLAGTARHTSIGQLATVTTAVGNVGTGEDDLMTYTIPAATLANNGDTVEFFASGTVLNNADTKRIRVRFGATPALLLDTTALPISAAYDWSIRGTITRTGATTQKCTAEFQSNNATANALVPIDYTTAAETLANALVLKITGDAGSTNNNIVQELFLVKMIPNPA